MNIMAVVLIAVIVLIVADGILNRGFHNIRGLGHSVRILGRRQPVVAVTPEVTVSLACPVCKQSTSQKYRGIWFPTVTAQHEASFLRDETDSI